MLAKILRFGANQQKYQTLVLARNSRLKVMAHSLSSLRAQTFISIQNIGP